jgi:WD40 repeat protein
MLSPDGQRLVVFDFGSDVQWRDTAQVWDTTTGQKLYAIPGGDYHTPNGGIVFSLDSRWLVLTDCSGTATIWNLATGAHRQTLRGDPGCILWADFSPDGKLVALGSANPLRGLSIWDIETGRELLTLPGTGDVRFMPDGKRIWTGVWEPAGLMPRTVRMYTLDLAELIAIARTRVTRALTPEECQEFLHTETCP